jgi:hypothetical protein
MNYHLMMKTLDTIKDVAELRNNRDDWRKLCQEMVLHLNPDDIKSIELTCRFNSLVLER